jgi:hypothetical protein
MNKTTAISLLSLNISPTLLCRKLEAVETLAETCRQLAAARDFGMLRQVATLIQSPLGRYYEAVAKKLWKDPGAFDVAVCDAHRPRVLLTIGQTLRLAGDVHLAQVLIREAGALAATHYDYLTAHQANKEMAIFQSLDGDHYGALRTLEKSYPLIKSLSKQYAPLRFDHLNSVATEMGEVGRLEEAHRFISIALASPFAPAYPEWLETRAELLEKGRGASRSIVPVVGMPHDNVILLPPPNDRPTTPPPARPAVVTSITSRRMNSQPKPQPAEELDRADTAAEIVRLIYRSSDCRLNEVLELLRRPEPEDIGRPG